MLNYKGMGISLVTCSSILLLYLVCKTKKFYYKIIFENLYKYKHLLKLYEYELV